MNDTDPATQLEVIDKQRALDLLDKALTERGEDYVYERPKINGQPECAYFDLDGQPSCIVGHALALHGYEAPKELLAASLNTSIATALPMYVNSVSREAAAVFRAAQIEQDSGSPWGVAVSAARSKAARL